MIEESVKFDAETHIAIVVPRGPEPTADAGNPFHNAPAIVTLDTTDDPKRPSCVPELSAPFNGKTYGNCGSKFHKNWAMETGKPHRFRVSCYEAADVADKPRRTTGAATIADNNNKLADWLDAVSDLSDAKQVERLAAHADASVSILADLPAAKRVVRLAETVKRLRGA